MFSQLKSDTAVVIKDIQKQDFAFWMACVYICFTYMKPQVTFPLIDFLPWIQVSIVSGLAYLIVKRRLRFQSTHGWVLLFIIIAANSIVNGFSQEYGWSRFDFLWITLLEMLFFTNCVRTIRQLQLILIVLFVSLFKLSLFGAKTWVERGFGFTGWGIAGPDGLFSNSGEFSLLMAVYATLSLGYIVGKKIENKLYLLAPITAIMTILGASSRGSQLAIAVGLVLFLIMLGKLKFKNVLIFCLVTYAAISVFPEEQKARFASMGEDDTSTSRLTYWEHGIEMMNDHKLTGVGYFGFSSYFADNYKHQLEGGFLSGRSEVAHNSVVEAGSELGYPGLFCYLWFHLHCILLNRRSRKKALKFNKNDALDWVPMFSTAVNITVVVYFIGAFFMSVAYYPYIYLLMMISLVLSNATSHHIAESSKDKN